jgi:GNAT superfamily N-acetyltransferase
MMGEYRLKSGVTVVCRKFQPKDSHSCSALLNQSFKIPERIPPGAHQLYEKELAPYDWQNILRTAQKRDYRVAEVDGRVVGVVGVLRVPPAREIVQTAQRHGFHNDYIDQHRPAAAEVLDLVVKTEFRHKKIGSILMMAALVDKIAEGIQHFHAYPPARAAPLMLYGGFVKASDELDSIRWGKVLPFYARFPEGKTQPLFEAMEGLMQLRHEPGVHS